MLAEIAMIYMNAMEFCCDDYHVINCKSRLFITVTKMHHTILTHSLTSFYSYGFEFVRVLLYESKFLSQCVKNCWRLIIYELSDLLIKT